MGSSPSKGDSVGVRNESWHSYSATDLAAAVDTFGKAYSPYAAFIRENGVDGAMVLACGGVAETLDMCEPKPTALHRQKFLVAAQKNEEAVAEAEAEAEAEAQREGSRTAGGSMHV